MRSAFVLGAVQVVAFALVAVIAVPTLLAFVLSLAMFKRRVGGVYFAIITQAFAAVLTILIVGRQGYTGGINGITDLRTMLGWDIRTDHAKYILYFACCALLLGSMLLSRFVLRSKLGRLLVAIRDKEDRVRFSGYDVANFKVFIFCLASAIAAVGGALFTLQVGFMSPSFVGIVPSIEMVIFCAVGGRQSIVGAVVGTLVVNWAKTSFSESFPELWLFAMGGLFIAVVLAFPRWARWSLSPAMRHATQPFSRQTAPGSGRCRDALPGSKSRGVARCRQIIANSDFLLAVEALSVSFDGFKAVDDYLFLSITMSSRHHRPQRRGQDHRARSYLRQDARASGSISFQAIESSRA